MTKTNLKNWLKNSISNMGMEGPTLRCSSLFYLINSLYLSYELNNNFKKYLDTKEIILKYDLCASAICGSTFLVEALRNGDLPERFHFIISTLREIYWPIQDKMKKLEEHTPTLEDIKTPNDFILKNLEDICVELINLSYTINHENNERCFEIESWWQNKIKLKKTS